VTEGKKLFRSRRREKKEKEALREREKLKINVSTMKSSETRSYKSESCIAGPVQVGK
jgi:hypothetical protein